MWMFEAPLIKPNALPATGINRHSLVQNLPEMEMQKILPHLQNSAA
jgi:hypothetical protein